MGKSHKVIVKILPGGDTEVSVDGFKGKKCSDVTKLVESAIGSVKTDKKLPAYFLRDDQGQFISGGN